MTLSPATDGNRRPHPLIDFSGHGVRSYTGDASTYLPEKPFLLLQTLVYYPPGTVVPYSTLAAVMWPDTVSDPYDGSYDYTIRAHLSGIRAIMRRDGLWPHIPFEVKPGVGICLIPRLLPKHWR